MNKAPIFILAFLTTIASATIVYPPVKYGQQVTIYFGLYDSNSPWRNYETAPAAGDVHVFQDGASEARATNAVTDLGRTFSLVLTAPEMQAAVVVVDINDIHDPPLYGDEQIIIPTFGHTSALQELDLDAATVSADVTKMGGHSMVGTGTQVADEFERAFNIASGTGVWTVASLNQTVDVRTALPQNVTFTSVGGTQMPKVNVGAINAVAATSVSTVNANVGTTQPVNFTGTGANAKVETDAAVDVLAATVTTGKTVQQAIAALLGLL